MSLVLAFLFGDPVLDGGGAVAEVFANDGGRSWDVSVKQVAGTPSAVNIVGMKASESDDGRAGL